MAAGTKDDPWTLRTPPGSSQYTMFGARGGAIRTKTLLDSMTSGIKEQFVYLRRTEKGVQTPVETLERVR